ncbi:extracellular solute-binding protein [Streptomyces sp. Go-475]|uniref:extracellular solute-binding protein n=1 Tax=Streptomyces sp. Go-475 TaxID=2072505 RepID=UPI000DEF100B|nr:extracellular solute-binding protein [Streptomyces sp. Go-475]AXE90436.1 hypothetical protein C1703_35935 [Streptomyces sp. Go-475]
MSNPVNRRAFMNGVLAVAGAATMSPLLTACGDGSGSKGGTNTRAGLAAALPAYQPRTSVKPDIPSVRGAAGAFTDPGYLTYPADPAKSVSGVPGKGGRYTAITPMWGTLPTPGNSYYQAVNKALGATVTVKPANGNDYATIVPTMTASRKLPDWIQLPSWWNNNFNLGKLAGTQLADLTPYLAGDKIKKYPNLAAIPTLAWQAGAWEDKIYGIPSFTSGMPLAGAVFYRADILESKGITAGQVRSADDLWNLGKELTSAKAGVWAFDDLWTYLSPSWDLPPGWKVVDGKLVHKYEMPQILEALDWHYRLAKAGFMHPDALAGNNSDGNGRFYSGKVLIQGAGMGAWELTDHQNGTAANDGYRRGAFDVIAADGKSKPQMFLGAATSMLSYLNAKLGAEQIEELLAVADFLAAPYGSAEHSLVTYGVEGTHHTRKNGAPVYTEEGKKSAQPTTYRFLATPSSSVSNLGADQVTKDYTAWCARTVRHVYKPLFYGMNITLPQNLSAVAAGQSVEDAINQVKFGKKKVSHFQDAVAAWKSSGGDRLRNWYQTEVLDKQGTGQ